MAQIIYGLNSTRRAIYLREPRIILKQLLQLEHSCICYSMEVDFLLQVWSLKWMVIQNRCLSKESRKYVKSRLELFLNNHV
jgi:hypothetical protein